MKYPREEQETIITKGALDDEWHIYTSDSVMITKFDKLVETSPEWRCVNKTTCQGEICAKDYRCSKPMVMFGSKRKKGPTLTEEEKAARGEFLKSLRDQK